MTSDLLSLARRAVACPRWRWMPGMLDDYLNRYMAVGESPAEVNGDGPEDDGDWDNGEMPQSLQHDRLPDLSDPATLGCLLALVREAWGDGGGFVRCALSIEDGRRIWFPLFGTRVAEHAIGRFATAAAALVAALEAAP